MCRSPSILIDTPSSTVVLDKRRHTLFALLSVCAPFALSPPDALALFPTRYSRWLWVVSMQMHAPRVADWGTAVHFLRAADTGRVRAVWSMLRGDANKGQRPTRSDGRWSRRAAALQGAGQGPDLECNNSSAIANIVPSDTARYSSIQTARCGIEPYRPDSSLII
ncbi:hypothetical protein B0H17DRAFT_1180794 [Mycena rosella]|uniref:Uncharacterized protein n=1 Tax=Mycena rosella TaxID=1033263 RepID=A0AAD7DD52_MYCRO|nr:hypothetical protein B0H17DRAFT_1180794 [Mycena rosella]